MSTARRGDRPSPLARPNATERRNALVDAHRAHLGPRDNTNCLARGGLTELALPLGVGRMAGEERGWTVNVGEELILEVLEERVGP